MEISQIDKNFELPKLDRDDVRWLDVREYSNFLFGVYYDERDGRYRRMPQEVANGVNAGVLYGSTHTAGGRLRFITNSPFIALKGVIDNTPSMYHMPSTGSHGFGLYAQNAYCGALAPIISNQDNIHGDEKAFNAIRNLPTQCLEEIEIYFPLYNGVKQLFIGVKEGSSIQTAKPYPYQKPVVFYGSSITQGGCASHTGNDYQGHLSRWLHFDYINLGFSGSAKGEQSMAEYIATLDSSVIVIDYDHNAPNVESLQETHYPFYATIRKAQPNTPILLLSRPDFYDTEGCRNRRATVYDTYKRAKKQGDKKIWFIDGETMFGKSDRDACTVDGCHPNDLGFYKMAETIRPVLKKVLKKAL